MPEVGDQSTSTEMLRKAQFQEKLCILNKEFIKQLEVWIKQCPHYDLSATVKSYLGHVKGLDRTYGGRAPNTPVKAGESANTPAPTHSGRVIAKAKRRTGNVSDDTAKTPSNKPASNVVSSTPAFPNAPKFRLSDVSAIAPLVECEREKETKQAPSMPATLPSTGGARKRAIRGGGPLGDSESVVFRGSDPLKMASTAPKTTLPNLPTLPKATPGFWNLSAKKDDENKEKDKQEKDKPAPLFPPISSFGGVKSESSSSNSPFSNKIVFGSSNSPFGSSSEKKKDEDKPKPAPAATPFTFGSLSSGSGAAPKMTFGGFGSTPAPATSTGSSSSAATPFTFGPPPTTSNDKKDDEEEEYVPPKAEVVENAEPGATLSVRCSAFKLVEKSYVKLGVGMLHLKENDGKKSILVRAATTTGTVWVNALLNKTMKVAKADDVKLRITCPTSATEMTTFLVRLPSAKEADQVREGIEKENQ